MGFMLEPLREMQMAAHILYSTTAVAYPASRAGADAAFPYLDSSRVLAAAAAAAAVLIGRCCC
jgi:hypothetical protein